MALYIVEQDKPGTLILGRRLSHEKLHAPFVYSMTLNLSANRCWIQLFTCDPSMWLWSVAFRHSSRPICKRTIGFAIKVIMWGKSSESHWWRLVTWLPCGYFFQDKPLNFTVEKRTQQWVWLSSGITVHFIVHQETTDKVKIAAALSLLLVMVIQSGRIRTAVVIFVSWAQMKVN
jgi:hypothetical protein